MGFQHAKTLDTYPSANHITPNSYKTALVNENKRGISNCIEVQWKNALNCVTPRRQLLLKPVKGAMSEKAYD